jgi:DNA-directed RNA polymerase specialized sigma24 family protein
MKDNRLEKELAILYKKFPEAKRLLIKLGCPAIETEDLFQEALLIYTRKKQGNTLALTVEPIYYVKNVCKLLWYNQSRKIGKKSFFEIDQELISIDSSDWFKEEMQLQKVELALMQIGKKCQELLHLFYGLGLNMLDIAKKIGLRNEKVVKAQKYRCIQKAKEEASKLTD